MGKLRKLTGFSLYTLLILSLVFVLPPPDPTEAAERIVLSEPRIATPGVYWYQTDDHRFCADYDGKHDCYEEITINGSPYPPRTLIPDDVDLSNYPPTAWEEPISPDQIVSIELHSVEWEYAESYTPAIPQPIILGSSRVRLETYTGGSHEPSRYEIYGYTEDGRPKYIAMYETPIKITWRARVRDDSGGGTPPGGGGPDPGTGGSSGSCTWTISAPSGGTRQTGSVMNPNAPGQIAADGVFDVMQGIPTSETTSVV